MNVAFYRKLRKSQFSPFYSDQKTAAAQGIGQRALNAIISMCDGRIALSMTGDSRINFLAADKNRQSNAQPDNY